MLSKIRTDEDEITVNKKNREIVEINDFFRLLDLAEMIKEKIDRFDEQISRIRLIQITIITLPILFIIFAKTFELEKWLYYSVTFFIASIGYSLAFELIASKRAKQLSPEILALNEVVSLIREIETYISQSEKWSLIERAEFRIRISRFDIKRRSTLFFKN